MQSYGATKADAQRFGAGNPRLAGQQVNYLTPPSVAASTPAVGAGGRPTPGSSPFSDN